MTSFTETPCYFGSNKKSIEKRSCCAVNRLNMNELPLSKSEHDRWVHISEVSRLKVWQELKYT